MARENDPSLEDLLARVDDKTIAMAIWGVRNLEQRWMTVPPGGALRLSWPLAPDFFARAAEAPRLTNDRPARHRTSPFGAAIRGSFPIRSNYRYRRHHQELDGRAAAPA